MSQESKMNKYTVYKEFKNPVDLTHDQSIQLAAVGHISPEYAMHSEEMLYERRDLFVKPLRFLPTSANHAVLLNPTVYIQDSVERQHGGKITSFVRRINDVVTEAKEISSQHHNLVPNNWHAEPYRLAITVSIKCGDNYLGTKSQKIISALNDIAQSGINIEFINKCPQNSPWNQVIQSMASHTK